MPDVSKIKQIALFQNIDEGTLGSLAPLFQEQQFTDGQVVFNEDDEGDEIFFIMSGGVDIIKLLDKKTGASQTLSSLGMGEFFGEMALFDQEKRSATAKAKGDVSVLKMHSKDFYSFLQDDVFLTIGVLGGMLAETIRRLRETDVGFVTIYETGRLLTSGENIDKILKGVLNKVLEVISTSEKGFIALWNQFSELFELCSSQGFKNKEVVLRKDDCLIKWLKENKERLMVPDVSASALFSQDMLPAYCGGSFILQPFIHREELLGFLLISSVGQKMEVRPSQINLLSGIAAQAAPVIANAQKLAEEKNRQRLQRAKFRM